MTKPALREDNCGNLDRPGRGVDDLSQVDWSTVEASIDQARIAEVLTRMDLRGKDVLHVGVGDSRLAASLAARVNHIDGVTMHPNEARHADSLKLDNYRVVLLNKYSKQLACLDNRYDFISDNNLGSYACCTFHFHRMLDNYCATLKRGGKILTDQRGMEWTYGCRPEWRMSYQELAELGKVFPLRASKITSTVYALEKT